MSRRKQHKRPKVGHNTHHILHYRRWWSKGYRQLLRKSFVYELPIPVHEALHNTVGPVPPLGEDEAKQLWIMYCEVKHEMDLFEALAWLQLHAPNSEFAIAIMAQYGFLLNNMERP